MSNSKASRHVTADELSWAKNILGRINAQGLPPGNTALEALTVCSSSSLLPSSMTDASKRQRDESDGAVHRGLIFAAAMSEAEFHVVRSPGAFAAKDSQSPYVPKQTCADAEIEQPSGIIMGRDHL